MKYIELQEAFELEINELDSNLTKPATSDMEYWLNASIDKFIKSRTFGNNFRTEGFEQTQKRTDDLRTLVNTQISIPGQIGNEFTITLPQDYMFTLGETAYISSDDNCWPKDSEGNSIIKETDVLEATIETINRMMINTFSEYRLHNNVARPLRLFIGDNIKLYTDGNYTIPRYELIYLRKPEKINLTQLPFSEYTDLPESTHQEIVKLAAQLYLENRRDPRYNTYSNEIASME